MGQTQLDKEVRNIKIWQHQRERFSTWATTKIKCGEKFKIFLIKKNYMFTINEYPKV